MLTGMMLILIVHLIRRISFPFSSSDDHLPRERVINIDLVLVTGRDGISDRIAPIFVGAEGLFAGDEVEAGTVGSFGSLYGKVLVDEEDVVEFGLTTCQRDSEKPNVLTASGPSVATK